MSGPDSLPPAPQPPPENAVRRRVVDALVGADLAPTVDDEGDVAVDVDGQKMFVRCVDGEMPLLRVFGQWRVGATVPADELARLRAASAVTARLNLVKVTLHDDVLLVAVDAVATPETDVSQLLVTSFPALRAAVQMWHVQAGGTTGGSPAAAGRPGRTRPR